SDDSQNNLTKRQLKKKKTSKKKSRPITPVGGAVTTQSSAAGGGVRCLGDSYYMSADVSQFEPHDIVVLDDGSISDTFTHKSLFPEDMDPLSVSGTLNPDGTLVVSVRRTTRFRIL
uniref:SHSP domain-containing protein n=1 Tax=Echeneis naucrates TaxID=173247 RepID=A0A665UH23_ECHNA